MEEILASIKRVIADEDRAHPAAQRPARNRLLEDDFQQPEIADVEEDVLELEEPLAEESGLMSEGSTSASRQSLAALAAMRQFEDSGHPADSGPLEAIVREMLRPMLKQWLDQRLPELVEDMVSREIARITGRRV